MRESTGILFGVLVVVFITLDALIFNSANMVFLGRRFLELIKLVAFWR